MTYVSSERAKEYFEKCENDCHFIGDFSIDWMMSNPVNMDRKEFQRERVASVEFKQGILVTILVNRWAAIPEVHWRVIRTTMPDGTITYKYELIDGLQRLSSIESFLNGEFALPLGMVVDGTHIGGWYVSDLKEKRYDLYELIINHRISCKYYVNITDVQASYLFRMLLNKTNPMVPQEIRNAIIGYYSDWIRMTARDVPTAHKLFERYTKTVNKEKREYLTHFSSKFKLNGRMETDAWLSQLIYLWKHDIKNGITESIHTKWAVNTQSPNGIYCDGFSDSKSINDLLNFAYDIITSVPSQFKITLTGNLSTILILYAHQLKVKYGSLIPSMYVKKFFDIYLEYSDLKKKLYTNLSWKGNAVQPFNLLFGGKNSTNIGTIYMILNHELDKDIESFGIVELDKKSVFNRNDIIRKWQEQGGKCFYTGSTLEEHDLAGDHYIPRSWGIKKGGVTEYSNLVVCSKHINLKKGNMSGKEFKEYCKTEGLV